MEIEELLSTPQIKDIMKNGGSIMVIGDTNTGKTTLCQFLIRIAGAKGLKRAFLDLDLGQSSLLPGTLNAYYEDDWKRETAHYFVGSISPSGVIPEVLKGVLKLKWWLIQRNPDFTVIDTTGYINTYEAISLKESKIKILSLDLIIILVQEELTPVIRETMLPLTKNFLFISPSSKVKSRGPEERKRYRESAFRRYFENAFLRVLNSSSFKENIKENLLNGRLIGLLDENEFMLSSAIINSFDSESRLEILTPYSGDPGRIKFIKFGNLVVNPKTGEHHLCI